MYIVAGVLMGGEDTRAALAARFTHRYGIGVAGVVDPLCVHLSVPLAISVERAHRLKAGLKEIELPKGMFAPVKSSIPQARREPKQRTLYLEMDSVFQQLFNSSPEGKERTKQWKALDAPIVRAGPWPVPFVELVHEKHFDHVRQDIIELAPPPRFQIVRFELLNQDELGVATAA